MDKKLFDGLMLSLNQAVAITKGKLKPSRTFTYEVSLFENNISEGIEAITD